MHQSPSEPPTDWEKNYPGLNWKILPKIEKATGDEKKRLMRLHNEMINRSFGFLQVHPKNARLIAYRTKRLQSPFFPKTRRNALQKEIQKVGQKRIEALTLNFGTAEREAKRQAAANAKKAAEEEAKRQAAAENKAAAEKAAAI